MKTIALGLAAALIPSVAAHGYVSSITIDGEEHKGPNVADGESGGWALPCPSSSSLCPTRLLTLLLDLPRPLLIAPALLALRSHHNV